MLIADHAHGEASVSEGKVSEMSLNVKSFGAEKQNELEAEEKAPCVFLLC